MKPRVSVILPTHNPHPTRLARTWAALRAQTMAAGDVELILVDNASMPPVELPDANLRDTERIVVEPTLGLTAARRTGLKAAAGEFVVFVDDDNVLAPDYLEQVLRAFERLPRVGALGGRSLPEFECPPPSWSREFFPLLALRDLGQVEQIVLPAAALASYPTCAPIGAGMALRREAVQAWLRTPPALADRTGADLTSAGDNDLVLAVLRAGWGVAYVPALSLTHLIPASRLDADYLCRLNRGIQRSWMRVLTHHGINPWPPVPRWTVVPRVLKAWVTHRAWSGPAARIRWNGARGHFEGRVRPTGLR